MGLPPVEIDVWWPWSVSCLIFSRNKLNRMGESKRDKTKHSELMGGSNGELRDPTSRLSDRAKPYRMEVSTEKSKIMTNSTNNNSADISTNGQKLEEVTSFTYLGATVSEGGPCSAEVRVKIASATAAMARLNRIWRNSTISFASKFKLYKSLVTSILLYGCETWTMLADAEKKRIQAFRT